MLPSNKPSSATWTLSPESENELLARDAGYSSESDDFEVSSDSDVEPEVTSVHFEVPPWMRRFPVDLDGKLCGYNMYTATTNIPPRRARRNTYNGKVQRLPDRNPYEPSSESEVDEATIAGPAYAERGAANGDARNGNYKAPEQLDTRARGPQPSRGSPQTIWAADT